MSITRAEAARLLAIASGWDNRHVGEAAAAAYFESGELGRWSFMEAAEAIKHYYTTTTDAKPWVMPSHITAYIKNLRQDRAMRETGREITSAPEPRVLAQAEVLARRLEIPAPFRPADKNSALDADCPHCKAKAGQSCTQPSRGGPRDRQPHPSRVEAAQSLPYPRQNHEASEVAR